MCSWIIIHGRFFFLAVPFVDALCYNIKLTDYAILCTASDENEPNIACKMMHINHNRPEKSRA